MFIRVVQRPIFPLRLCVSALNFPDRATKIKTRRIKGNTTLVNSDLRTETICFCRIYGIPQVHFLHIRGGDFYAKKEFYRDDRGQKPVFRKLGRNDREREGAFLFALFKKALTTFPK